MFLLDIVTKCTLDRKSLSTVHFQWLKLLSGVHLQSTSLQLSFAVWCTFLLDASSLWFFMLVVITKEHLLLSSSSSSFLAAYPFSSRSLSSSYSLVLSSWHYCRIFRGDSRKGKDAENQIVSDSFLCKSTDSIFKFVPSEIPNQFFSLMIAKFGRFITRWNWGLSQFLRSMQAREPWWQGAT